ncbi:MAG: ATP-dependent zinc metalloprotease FtsH [Acidobacteriota bacterium]
MNPHVKQALVWGAVILLILLAISMLTESQRRTAEIPYSDFLKAVSEGDVKEVTIDGMAIAGRYADGKGPTDGRGGRREKFQTHAPDLEGLVGRLEAADVSMKAKPEPSDLLGYMLIVIPLLVLVVLWILFMRQMQGTGAKAMSFGKSRARLLSSQQKKVTFKDVAGCDESKEELREIIEFLKDPQKFARLGGKIPTGVLLVGRPGTGKTLMARAIAGEANVPFFSLSGSDFVEMFVGVGASRVRDLFEQGKKNAPCIIFIDEIDAVGRRRGTGLGGGHDEREQTLNALLVEMDGFETNEGVIIVAATNRPDVLDPALLRPGRFDRQVTVGLPDVRGREGILKVHTRKIPLADEIDLNLIARGTPGMSGADLANLVNEAALLAARANKKLVGQDEFERARDKVIMGLARKTMVISDKEKAVTANHEAGHALTAAFLEHAQPVHKITIIPHARALGVTQTLPAEDRHTWTKAQLEAQLAMLMGGRAAEWLVFSEVTTGAEDDIKKATDIARRMVSQWGMSEELGPVGFSERDEHVFLGQDIVRNPDYSEKTAQEIDAEVRNFLDSAWQTASGLLKENRDCLDRVASALLERETLSATDFQTLVDGGELAPLPPPEDSDGSEEGSASTEDDDRTDPAPPIGEPILQPLGD